MAKHSCKCFMLHLDKEFRILPNIKGSQGPYFIRKLSPLLIKPDVVVDVLKKKKKPEQRLVPLAGVQSGRRVVVNTA